MNDISALLALTPKSATISPVPETVARWRSSKWSTPVWSTCRLSARARTASSPMELQMAEAMRFVRTADTKGGRKQHYASHYKNWLALAVKEYEHSKILISQKCISSKQRNFAMRANSEIELSQSVSFLPEGSGVGPSLVRIWIVRTTHFRRQLSDFATFTYYSRVGGARTFLSSDSGPTQNDAIGYLKDLSHFCVPNYGSVSEFRHETTSKGLDRRFATKVWNES